VSPVAGQRPSVFRFATTKGCHGLGQSRRGRTNNRRLWVCNHGGEQRVGTEQAWANKQPGASGFATTEGNSGHRWLPETGETRWGRLCGFAALRPCGLAQLSVSARVGQSPSKALAHRRTTPLPTTHGFVAARPVKPAGNRAAKTLTEPVDKQSLCLLRSVFCLLPSVFRFPFSVFLLDGVFGKTASLAT